MMGKQARPRRAHIRNAEVTLTRRLAAGGPIETDACRYQAKVQKVNHVCSLSGHPRPVDWIAIDGRSPGLRISVFHPPSRDIRSGVAFRPRAWSLRDQPRDRQSAYSCGGSHGLDPYWVVLTVFPINPLGVIFREPSPPVTSPARAPSMIIQRAPRHRRINISRAWLRAAVRCANCRWRSV